MSAEYWAAIVFAVMTACVVAFQVALALGAPWGSFAMGGRFPGKYPPAMRLAALIQAVMLAVVAFLMLSAAGVVAAPWGLPPRGVPWLVSGLLGIGLVLNLITPSAGERRIWAPIVGVMLVCSLVIALNA